MTNRLGVSLLACFLPAAVVLSLDAVDRSFDHAYWTNESSAKAASRVTGALREWKALPAARLPECVSPLTSVSGFWIGSADPAMGCIRITKRSSSGYAILFQADGHEGGWRMRRMARLTAGALEFSGPLLDYELPPYGRMYALAVGTQRWLVPETALGAVSSALVKGGCQSISPNRVIGILYEPATGDNEQFCRELLGLAPAKDSRAR